MWSILGLGQFHADIAPCEHGGDFVESFIGSFQLLDDPLILRSDVGDALGSCGALDGPAPQSVSRVTPCIVTIMPNHVFDEDRELFISFGLCR